MSLKSNDPSKDPSQAEDPISPENLELIDALCMRFEESLDSLDQQSIEQLLNSLPDKQELRCRALEELLPMEWDRHTNQSDEVTLSPYLERFPKFTRSVQRAFAAWTEKCKEQQADQAHGSTLDFAAHSRAEDLAKWIERYRESQAAEPSLRPSEWLARLHNVPSSLRTAMRGMEFLAQLNPGATGQGNRIGDFQILREIGRGGMGVVFQAEQKSLGRIVALKVLWFASVSDPEAIRRFQREASTVAKLHHTNIVPIFSVGTEGPINYYAMQFIEGQSLDRVAKERGGPIDWTTVAEWGLQAAEALEHAHHRGVIHRDVKPSNLLLDPENRIWLTDFGLAKRNDDVTLSMAGALLGTPRYMSPEQASASTRQVDHRSDLYSLGATLYELATGKPVFESSTPHGVISQILTAQPTPANQVARDIPRDFSTILMKCLSKNADERYASARALANDLRALLEGRPIQAKRPNLIEQSQQWVRRHRREFGWSVTSVAVSALLLLVLGLSWFSWHQLREVQVSLNSPMSPIVAELLHADGSQALRRQTVPTQDPLQINPGNYTMRVAAPGLLSQDYNIELDASERRKQSLNPDDQLLMPAIGNQFETTLVKSPNGAFVVAYDETQFSVISQKGPNRGTIQTPITKFINTETSRSLIWPPVKAVGGQLDNADKFDVRPWISKASQDWNNDGREDIIVAMRHQALLALVGRDGNVIWSVGLAPDVSETPPATAQNSYPCPRSTIVELPTAIGDIDSDSSPDVLVQVVQINPWGNPDLTQAQRHLIALSGATGKLLWDFPIPRELFDLPAGTNTAYYFRWFTGINSSSSGGGGGYYINQNRWSRSSSMSTSRTSEHVTTGSVLPSSGSENENILFLAGQSIVNLDRATGKLVGEAHNLGHIPFQPPAMVELDGKDGKELVFLEDLDGQTDTSTSPPSQIKYHMRVVACSLSEKGVLWKHEVSAHAPFTRNWLMDPPRWPTVADLDGDGRCEVIVPDDTVLVSRPDIGESSLVALSGDQGKVLWKQKVRHADTQLERFAIGPDVNGDKHRDILVSSVSGLPVRAHVDCLSGMNGDKLWSSFAAIESNESPESFYLDEPFIWESLEDGWPQFVVRLISTQNLQNGTEAYFFSSGTGQVLHRVVQAHRIAAGDFNGDGVDDLALTKYEVPDVGMSGKCTTRLIRGSSGTVWRNLGSPMSVVADLDGDQLEDLVAVENQTVMARSAATGKRIWQTSLDEFWSHVYIHGQSKHGEPTNESGPFDFDHDGTNDLLLEMVPSGFPGSPLQAVSGRTGRIIWKSSFQLRYQADRPKIECRDLDQDGNAEIVLYGFNDTLVDAKRFRSSYSSQDGNLMLIVLSASSGKVKWQIPLSREYGSVSNIQSPYNFMHQSWPELNYCDLNFDGCADVIAIAESTSARSKKYATEVVAIDGRNGQSLWKRPASESDDASNVFSGSSRLAASPDTTENRVVYFLNCEDEARDNGAQTRFAKVTCYDAKQQRDLWTKSVEIDLYFSRNSQDRQDYLHPQILKRSDGAVWVALRIVRSAKAFVVVADQDGNIVGERQLEGQNFSSQNATRLLVADCDGDGNDEIITGNNGLDVLRVTDAIELMYHLDIPIDEWSSRQYSLLPPGPNREAQLLVSYDDANPRVIGFDVKSGNRLWESHGPTRHRTYSGDGNALQVISGAEDGLPWVIFNNLDQVDCQIASRIGSQSIDQKAREKLTAAYRKRWNIDATDPRLLRYLPWYESIDAARTSVEFPLLITNGLLSSIVMAILPSWYIQRTLRRRSFDLKWWLLAPVIAAIWIVFLMSRIGELPVSKPQKFGFAVYLAPAVVLAFGLIAAVIRMRWKTLGSKLAGILAISALLAIASFVENLPSRPLQAGEYFSLQGWYWITLYGFFVWGWIELLLLAPAKWIRSWWNRRHTKLAT